MSEKVSRALMERGQLFVEVSGRSDSAASAVLAAQSDQFVRGIGHLILMKSVPEVAKALNLSGFVPGRGTHANDDTRPAAPLAAGGERHGG